MYIVARVLPFFIQHGNKDNIVPHQQSVNFTAMLGEIAGDERVTLELIEGVGHGDPKFDSAKNVKNVWKMIFSFL